MRPTPALSQPERCASHECALTEFRRLPRASELPAEQAVLARQEVALAVITLPNGTFQALSMLHSRLGRPATLTIRTMDRAGRLTGGIGQTLETQQVEELVAAGMEFLARAKPAPKPLAEDAA